MFAASFFIFLFDKLKFFTYFLFLFVLSKLSLYSLQIELRKNEFKSDSPR